MLVILSGDTAWALTIRQRRKDLDENYTRMLNAVLNEYWKWHVWKEQNILSIFGEIRKNSHDGLQRMETTTLTAK